MDPFEENYTKVASKGELTPEKPRVFRSAGAMVVLRLGTDDSVEAIDGSCFNNDRSMPSDARLQQILDCIAAGAGSSSSDWSELVSRAGLPVEVVDGDVWVCLEQCRE